MSWRLRLLRLLTSIALIGLLALWSWSLDRWVRVQFVVAGKVAWLDLSQGVLHVNWPYGPHDDTVDEIAKWYPATFVLSERANSWELPHARKGFLTLYAKEHTIPGLFAWLTCPLWCLCVLMLIL